MYIHFQAHAIVAKNLLTYFSLSIFWYKKDAGLHKQ